MVVNLLITNLVIISNIVAFFMKPHAPKLLSKTVLPSEKIDIETAQALLIGANAPPRYWANTVTTVVHLLNRMPSKVLGFQTPLQALAAHTPLPSVLMLPPRVFGCVAYVHIHKTQRTKLEPCARRCLFLGTHFIKKAIDAMTPPQIAPMSPWMSPSWNPKPFSHPILLFRGRLDRKS